MRKRWMVGVPVVALVAVPGPVHADHGRPAACSARASFVGFSDALDKTVFQGTQVAGLSALSMTSRSKGLALVDNIGTSDARVYGLSVRKGVEVGVRSVTVLRRADGTPYNGSDFDGEGLVSERGGTILASSETEPSIRRFRLSDGRQVAELPVPARFKVAPAGEAARNQTFEALSATPGGRSLYAGMEGPLSSDGPGLLRILRYRGASGGTYTPAGQYAYKADTGLGLVELIAMGGDRLLALERGFTAGVGNTVRVYQVSAARKPDVSSVPSLTTLGDRAFLGKRLLVDLADCPPSGAPAKQPQPNPLLDNVEAMALRDRHTLYLLSDDNGSATQITRFYALRVTVS